MNIRAYTAADAAACLELFDGNTPPFFAPHERVEFAQWLVAPDGVYLVGERDGQVVACGGYAILAPRPVAVLTWGMVARALHGQGLGRQLLEHRVAAIRRDGRAEAIVLQTSQHSAPFFARAGFVTEKVTPDGFGPRIDRHDMRLGLR